MTIDPRDMILGALESSDSALYESEKCFEYYFSRAPQNYRYKYIKIVWKPRILLSTVAVQNLGLGSFDSRNGGSRVNMLALNAVIPTGLYL